jgi:hypothetical protein
MLFVGGRMKLVMEVSKMLIKLHHKIIEIEVVSKL